MNQAASLKSLSKLLPLLVLAISLTTTGIMWRLLEARFTLEARREFSDGAQKIVDQLAERLNDHEHLLFGAEGLFSASDVVNRQEWLRYFTSLKLQRHHPGIRGVGYAAWLTPEGKEAQIRNIRQEGFPEFRIYPEGRRPAYSVVTYLEPFNEFNRRSFGYDMYSEASHRVAMDRARDSGETSLVSDIVLVQEPRQETQRGMVMYLPVYRRGMPVATREQRRAALKGFVYSPIRMKDFIYGSLVSMSDDIAFSLYDGDSPQPEKLQFSSLVSGNVSLPPGYHSALTTTRKVQLYGRTWTFTFRSLPVFDREFNKTTSWTALATGILISLLLSVIAFTMQRTRDRAMELARSMTKGLHESEEKIRLILDTAGAAIYGIGMDGCCTFCNPACLRVLGYESEEELLGRSMHDLIHHSHPDGTPYAANKCPVDKVCRTGAGCYVDGEYFWRSDGTCFPVEYWSRPKIKGGRISGAVISFIDITERRKVQESLLSSQQELETLNQALEKRVADEVTKNRTKDQALMQSDKLASIGQLAAGVAHEINNPMSYIISNLELLTHYLDQLAHYDTLLQKECDGLSVLAREKIQQERDSRDIEYILTAGGSLITESLEGAGRVAKIVRDLKTFSRVDGEEDELIDLNSCLESALTIVHNELKYLATIRKEYGQLPEIRCNPGQLNQVFLNLLVNAGHAIVSPGVIELRSWCDEEFVYASVSDTGQGIPEEIRSRLFEPFFTTKEEGRGTGLGLSISSDIIGKHNGKILVESEVGAGSTFTIILPRILEECT
jgi:two-component system, cell cycle sensor histidine kinase and response regulator CckA